MTAADATADALLGRSASPADAAPPEELAARLLAWYDRSRRILPWRAPPGAQPDPYRVWLSEIMLQQTTVAAAGPYFQAFVARWPTVADLAAASDEAVMQAWAGLGYYARARNLLACARQVAAERGGVFPDSEEELRALPGVGPYTAAAVAAIAFDRPASAVDGNVERVIARLRAVEEPMPAAKPRMRALAAEIVPAGRPGDYAQAIMDLGATVCAPRRPKCALCPWRGPCAAQARGIAEDLPRKAAKPARPLRRGVAYWLIDGEGRVLLRRRPPKGLLGGMEAFPSSGWEDDADPQAGAPAAALWRELPGEVRHVFSHFELRLKIWAARVAEGEAPEGDWVRVDALGERALPSLMRKVARHALAQVG